jgi:hypothetical protein
MDFASLALPVAPVSYYIKQLRATLKRVMRDYIIDNISIYV